MAFATLWSHRLRSALTIIGIIIGVTAIVGMTSLVRGLDSEIVGEIRDIGADHMFLRKWAGRIVAGERELMRLERRPDITEQDEAAIRRLPSVKNTDIMLGTAWCSKKR
jgi:ABC-type antimicrobial peptide transport system permease subunit